MEVTVLVALAGTGMVTVVMVVTDTATGRRATVRDAAIMTAPAVAATDVVITDMALARMVRNVAAMDPVVVITGAVMKAAAEAKDTAEVAGAKP